MDTSASNDTDVMAMHTTINAIAWHKEMVCFDQLRGMFIEELLRLGFSIASSIGSMYIASSIGSMYAVAQHETVATIAMLPNPSNNRKKGTAWSRSRFNRVSNYTFGIGFLGFSDSLSPFWDVTALPIGGSGRYSNPSL